MSVRVKCNVHAKRLKSIVHNSVIGCGELISITNSKLTNVTNAILKNTIRTRYISFDDQKVLI